MGTLSKTVNRKCLVAHFDQLDMGFEQKFHKAPISPQYYC